MAYVAELGYLDGHDHAMVGGDRIIQSIEGMERACFQETNRLVRIRMLGGVAGVRSNAAPMPIALICEFCGLQDGLSEQIGERVDARILERRFNVRSVSGTAF